MGKKRESSRYERHVHDSMAAILCTTVLSRQDRLSPRRVDAVLCVRAVGSGWAETDGRGKHRAAHRTPDTATGHGTLLHKNCYMYQKTKFFYENQKGKTRR